MVSRGAARGCGGAHLEGIGGHADAEIGNVVAALVWAPVGDSHEEQALLQALPEAKHAPHT